VLVIAEVVSDLALECGLQQPLGQLLQHPAFTGQLQPAGLRAAQQLRDELLIQAVQTGRGRRILGVLHAGHHVGHQVHFHDQELHRSFTVPREALPYTVATPLMRDPICRRSRR